MGDSMAKESSLLRAGSTRSTSASPDDVESRQFGSHVMSSPVLRARVSGLPACAPVQYDGKLQKAVRLIDPRAYTYPF